VKRFAAIALGSNLASPWGDREANLREAIARVAKLGEVRAVSSFHDTAPVGFIEQPNFLNGAMLLETELEPVELMCALLAIERAMGRDRAAVVTDAAQSAAAPIKGPRIIDLDLLLMDDLVLACAFGLNGEPALTLPHPAMAERRFVLEPLAEIAPAMVDPLSGRMIAQMLARLNQP
jgi:2-amino-4-hydroxy-6-hydroxymethyldihydropteridine diphosphokinase